MNPADAELIIRSLTTRIKQLEAENEYLKKIVQISKVGDSSFFPSNVEYVGNAMLKQAIEKINNNKWVEASTIIAKQYGQDFMIKESVNFSILKKAMYEYYKMPEAPSRSDKSIEANKARERRKNIRATVYTYIDRMGDYYMKQIG